MKLTNVEPPRIGIRMEEVSTVVYINNDFKGTGTLYVTENDIKWINNTNEGFIIKYPDISLFAICTDHEKYPEDCIFMLIKDEETDEEMEDDDSDDDYSKEVEVRFAPPDGTDIRVLFNIIQECNKLHPNENDDMVSDDSNQNKSDNTDSDEDELENKIVLNGNADLKNLADGQFDDAEVN